MKNVFLVMLLTMLAVADAVAQESQEVYSFLRLPVSAHVAALVATTSPCPITMPP